MVTESCNSETARYDQRASQQCGEQQTGLKPVLQRLSPNMQHMVLLNRLSIVTERPATVDSCISRERSQVYWAGVDFFLKISCPHLFNLPSGDTRMFWVVIEGAKCITGGAKIWKIVENDWFWPFFSYKWLVTNENVYQLTVIVFSIALFVRELGLHGKELNSKLTNRYAIFCCNGSFRLCSNIAYDFSLISLFFDFCLWILILK